MEIIIKIDFGTTRKIGEIIEYFYRVLRTKIIDIYKQLTKPSELIAIIDEFIFDYFDINLINFFDHKYFELDENMGWKMLMRVWC